MKKIIYILIPLLFITVSNANANEAEDLTVIRNTVVNLLQELVNQGVMTREQAAALVQNAQQKAQQEASLLAEQKKASGIEEDEEDAIRVQYVPEHVKEEIRNEVREELKKEVVDDVIAHAETERWGVKDTLPEWVSKLELSGDLRVRAQQDLFASGNVPTGLGGINDFNEINSAGSFSGAGDDRFINTDKDRFRERVRLRLGIDAQVNESFKAGIRLATGNGRNPVSTNQTLGNTGGKYEFSVDRAYLEYTAKNKNNFPWLTFSSGRIANPWLSTDLVFDNDLSFEGTAGTLRWNLGGPQFDRQLFFTAGAFPLEEFDIRSGDKWLFAGQLGTNWQFSNNNRLNFGLAYYGYENLRAKRNTVLGSTEFDHTAPEFMQKGNTLYDIDDPDGNPDTVLFGLASKFQLWNATASYSFANVGRKPLTFTADYVVNEGYDEDDVISRAIGSTSSDHGDTGYAFRVDYGAPKIHRRHDWNAHLLYKHVESDAVLDAFTDSNFNLGGTNTEGYSLGINYGLLDNVWTSLEWISTDEIDGANFGVDSLRLDLNSRF